MYYDLSNEAKVNNSTSLSFGTFSITSDQLLIGLMSELISLIPSILLIQIFRRLRSRHQRIPPLEKVFHQIKPTRKFVKKKCSMTFPLWCLFIAYAISLVLVLASIFFIIALGIEFDDVKSQQWLISVLLTEYYHSLQ